MKNRKTQKIIALLLSFLLLIGCTLTILVYQGIILLNGLNIGSYPVRGVDVSSYQGNIDWSVLQEENIQFAFIKATEGSSYVDPKFSENYHNTLSSSLRIGYYHFFSFDSAGITQAENFIQNVPKTENMLPPVVDVEFYGDKEQNPPKSEDVVKELSIFIETLESYYDLKPIIYATDTSYNLYIKESFQEYDLWIRSVYTKPSEDIPWTFWQYTNREKLDGYIGEETFIDMNVFSGSMETFEKYGIH